MQNICKLANLHIHEYVKYYNSVVNYKMVQFNSIQKLKFKTYLPWGHPYLIFLFLLHV